MTTGRRAALALAALLLSGGAQSARAAVRYVAFGDSVTRGNACNRPGQASAPSDVFDEDGSGCKLNTPCDQQTQDDADNCGYTYRLESTLLPSIPDAEVINAGDAGETIVEGLSRIDSEISAGDDVLILMEGTNDLSKWIRGDQGAISPADMADILGLMIDKATAVGMDTLIGSVIRRVCPQYPGVCPGYPPPPPPPPDPRPEAWPDEAETSDFNQEVSALSDEKRRNPRFSAWFKLGKTQGDVDSDYYQEDLRIGHLRGNGYQTLAKNVIKGNILDHPALGAPTPVSPIGDVDGSAVFTWDDHPDGEDGATLWQLQVEGPLGGAFHDEFYEQFEICAAGTCSIDIGSLDPGDYTWKVRGKNLRGPSPYSADTAFTVTSPSPPGGTTLVYPLDQVYQTDPPFRWKPALLATDYRLDVDGGETLVSSAACTADLCTATRGVALSFGFHTWSVQPTNANGDGPETPLESLDVLECTMPFDLVLDADDVGTGSFFTICDQIQARDGYKVQNGESVTLWGGEEVVLFDTFLVEDGGSLTAGTDH